MKKKTPANIMHMLAAAHNPEYAAKNGISESDSSAFMADYRVKNKAKIALNKTKGKNKKK